MALGCFFPPVGLGMLVVEAEVKKTGFGIISYKNGSYFRGNVLDGLKHGHGEIFDALTKIRFKGVWSNDTIQGEVTITSSQWQFFGEIPDCDGNTKGEMKYANGSFYTGELKDFIRHGKGILKTHLEAVIEGFGKTMSMFKKPQNGTLMVRSGKAI